MKQMTDNTLVGLAKNGDRAALSELLGRYERKAYQLAFRLTGNHADASDAAQEGLVRVYTRLHHFRGESAFSTWLFRVVTNTCLDEIRRRNRLRHSSLDEPFSAEDGPTSRHAIDMGDSPVDWVERRETQETVQQAILELSADYRAVVVLRDIQDYSYQEIAEILKTSVGTIKSRLHRARLALRSILQTRPAFQRKLSQTA